MNLYAILFGFAQIRVKFLFFRADIRHMHKVK